MKRIASEAACFDPDHGHVVVAHRHDLGGERWLTAWLCPVRRNLSAILEDDAPIPDERRPRPGLLDRLRERLS